MNHLPFEVSQREEPKWEKVTIRHQTITLNNLRRWQFWRPKYQTFRLDISMQVAGVVNVSSVQVELTPEDKP